MNSKNRAAAGGLAGLVAASAFLASPILDDEAKADGCQQSFSKYSGTYCVPPVSNRVKKDAATILFGCAFGFVGANPAAVGYGCLAGGVGVLIDHTWGGS